jgi:5-methylcytosine-specific restriction endonuclease McrA
MAEVDFKNLGILPNDTLLDRINSALNEIHILGDLQLHATWLYFGGIKPAAKELGISPSLFRRALQRKISPNYSTLSEVVRADIWIGGHLILEMPDGKRMAACSIHSITREQFISQIRAWEEACDSQIVSHCVRLLRSYIRLWKYRRHPNVLFQASGFTRPVQVLLTFRKLTEERALDSKVCSVALEIIEEYESYLWHRQAVTSHIKIQRGIQNRNRAKLYDALVLRDGERCQGKDCKSKRKLLIDHRKPLVLGGFTEMRNLQLLCFPCNSKKSDAFEEDQES